MTELDIDEYLFFQTKKYVKSLENCCCDIVSELSDYQLRWYLEKYFESVGDEKKNSIINSKSREYTEFPLNLSLLLFTNEKHWEERCLRKNWTLVHYWFHFCSWKSTYVSCCAEELIDNFICGACSFGELENSLLRFKDHLYTLKVNGYKLKYINSNFQAFTAKNGNALLEDYVSKIISMFPLLRELYLNNIPINYELTLEGVDNSFSDHSVQHLNNILPSLITLQKLSLIGTYMKPPLFCEMLKNLRSLNNLVELNFSCNLISDDTCEDIAELLHGSIIQKLVLSNNKIGDIGAKHLARVLQSHKHLKSLYVDQNVIEDEGARFIVNSILDNSCVSKLDISHNKVTVNATDIFCKLLTENTSLEYLNLAGNHLGKEAGAKICRAVKLNKILAFFGHQYCGFAQCDEDGINVHIAMNYTIVHTEEN